jgi:hypothetical protein
VIQSNASFAALDVFFMICAFTEKQERRKVARKYKENEPRRMENYISS